MRDTATTELILALVRELMLRDPGITFGQLVHSAAKFAVPESEVLSISDEAILRALRARCYRNRLRPMKDATVSVEQLAALDEARDENNSFANDWLAKELEAIRGWVLGGDVVKVADDAVTTLESIHAFEVWCRERYPAAASILLQK